MFNVLGYEEQFLFDLFSFCRWFSVFHFFVFIYCYDSTELGTHRAATPLVSTDVNELWSLAGPSSITIPLLDTPNAFDHFYFSNRSTGLQKLWLVLALWPSRYERSFLWSGQISCSLRAAMFVFPLCVKDLFFHFPYVPIDVSVPQSLGPITCWFSLQLSVFVIAFCAPVGLQLRMATCEIIALRYLRLSKYCIHAFRSHWTLL